MGSKQEIEKGHAMITISVLTLYLTKALQIKLETEVPRVYA